MSILWWHQNKSQRIIKVRGYIAWELWISLPRFGGFFVPILVCFTLSKYESYLNAPFCSILETTLFKFNEDIWPHYSSHPPPDCVSLSMCQIKAHSNSIHIQKPGHQALSGGNIKKVHSFFHHLQCLISACRSKWPLN